MLPKERRVYRFGYLRAMRLAQKDLHAMAQRWDSEIATELYRERYSRAVDEAILERTANPGALLN